METKNRGRNVSLSLGLSFVVLTAALTFSNWKRMRTRYLLWRDFESLGINVQGYPEYIHRQTGLVFVGLPAGTFWMGGTEEEGERFLAHDHKSVPTPERYPGQFQNLRRQSLRMVESEQPRHRVQLNRFLISKYEVSQEQWERFMGTHRSPVKGQTLPVEGISWSEARTFCEKTGLRLPSEAQWEYACRAGTNTPFAYGDDISSTQVNYMSTKPWGEIDDGEYRGRSVPVDSLEPNGFGLYNVHGNVKEWCGDVWTLDFYSRPEATAPDPICSSGSDRRVCRGGSWISHGRYCRSAYRRMSSLKHTQFCGLRPVYDFGGTR